jgi:preprotein translocase subunit SecG
MIFTFVLIVHVIVCLVLFGVILIQQGKGASMGAAFGTGGSQTVFGGSGAGNFLTKTTWVCAAIFFSTSLILAYQSSFHRSVIEDVPAATDTKSDTTKPGETGKTEPGKADAKAGDKTKPEAAKTDGKTPAGAPAKTAAPTAPGAAAPAPAPAKASAPAPTPAVPAAPAAK